MSDLAPEAVRPLLRGAFGDPYLYLAETLSTQDVLRDGDFPHGAVCTAEHQTAGRGRSGRSWDDAPSTGLLFSTLLRAPEGAALPQLSLVVGLAVATAIESEACVRAGVKWPNDVLVDGRKVAGILLEASGSVVVCGVGINVNQVEPELPIGTRFPATSLRISMGRPFDRGRLLAAVLYEIEHRYDAWVSRGLAGMHDDLEQRNTLRGRPVRVGDRAGTAGAVAPDGRLMVVLEGGDVVLVESGEVEVEVGQGARAPAGDAPGA